MIDWDAWRERYDSTSFAEQQDFYDEVFRLHRGQRRFTVDALRAFLEHISRHIAKPVSVIELGGWDGELAAEILAGDSLVYRWTNYEISREAIRASVCRSRSYLGIACSDWYWTNEHAADLLIASHVFEHLRFREVQKVLDASDVDWLYLEIPVGSDAPSWNGYHGSHILEVGWAELGKELAVRGFRELKELGKGQWVRCFGRIPISTAEHAHPATEEGSPPPA